MDKILFCNSIKKNAIFTFAHASGAGGQNLNKVNTKVHATVDIALLEEISFEEKIQVLSKLRTFLNKDGHIFVDVQNERTQELNRKIALERLESKIVTTLKPKKNRIKTKPTKSSIEKRLKIKKIRAKIKKSRHSLM